MPVSARTLQALMAAGLSGDQLVEIVACIDADMAPKIDTAAEKRRAYDRERKRNSGGISGGKLSLNSGGNSGGIPPETDASRVRDKPLKLVLSGKKEEEPNGSSIGEMKRKPSRRVPADYEPKASVLGIPEAQEFTPGEIERELAKFKDHQYRDARTDWDAAFRNWLRTAAGNHHGRQHPTHESKQADNLAAAERGARLASQFRQGRSHGG